MHYIRLDVAERPGPASICLRFSFPLSLRLARSRQVPA